MNDGFDGPVRVFTERVGEFPGGHARFGTHGNRLHAHGAQRVRRVDERQVIRRDSDTEQLGRLVEPGALIVGERNEVGEPLRIAHRVTQLPLPITPLGVGGGGEQRAPPRHRVMRALWLERADGRRFILRLERHRGAP